MLEAEHSPSLGDSKGFFAPTRPFLLRSCSSQLPLRALPGMLPVRYALRQVEMCRFEGCYIVHNTDIMYFHVDCMDGHCDEQSAWPAQASSQGLHLVPGSAWRAAKLSAG